MKILAFSDLHLARPRAADLVAASRDADLVIGAGDFCNYRQGIDKAMAMLDGIEAPFVTVPGNNESLEELKGAAPEGMIILHGEGVEIGGLKLFGLGYGVPVTPFGEWSCDLSEDAAEEMLGRCEAADILITHSPPKGIGDRIPNGMHLGSTAIAAAIGRIAPSLALCGHIHEGWGQEGTIGTSRVVNLGPTVNWFEL